MEVQGQRFRKVTFSPGLRPEKALLKQTDDAARILSDSIQVLKRELQSILSNLLRNLRFQGKMFHFARKIFQKLHRFDKLKIFCRRSYLNFCLHCRVNSFRCPANSYFLFTLPGKLVIIFTLSNKLVFCLHCIFIFAFLAR